MIKRWFVIGIVTIAVIGVCWVLFDLFSDRLRKELMLEVQMEARNNLSHICQLQQQNFDSTGSYSSDLEDLGFFQVQEDDSRYWYQVVAADSLDFVLRAYGKFDFDKDQLINVWEIRKDCKALERQTD